MRIIGGTARGRHLKTPDGQEIRPTSDKVRLAMFNALFSRGGVVDKIILDAFCGTGALGCEALSHGAAQAMFCDISRTSLNLAKENVTTLGFSDRAEFLLKDANKIGVRPPTQKPADIIFLDPPYRKGLVPLALQALKDSDWLAENCIIVIETEGEWSVSALPFGNVLADKTYGDTRVLFVGV